jgi:hypothetical protein
MDPAFASNAKSALMDAAFASNAKFALNKMLALCSFLSHVYLFIWLSKCNLLHTCLSCILDF